MESIVIGFSRPRRFKVFGWMIMTAYGTNYDHVYLRIHSESIERDIIYQASKLMINFVGSAVFESENEIVKEFEISISSEHKKSLMQFAIDNAGKPYSFREVLGLAWVRLNALFGKKISNPLRDGQNAYVCSVIQAYILENYTGDNIPGDFEDVSPKDLYDYLTSKQANV